MTTLAAQPMPRRSSRRRMHVRPLGKLAAWMLLALVVLCWATLPLSAARYQQQHLDLSRQSPTLTQGFAPFGYDVLGRNMFWRCLFGGAMSLTIGAAAAVIAVVMGTLWGGLAGWWGGKADNIMMRVVDILYGLPYILIIILLKVAFEPRLVGLIRSMPWLADGATKLFGAGPEQLASIMVLFLAIGSVSWLTMARVIRGQVLALKAQPFMEAARAQGVSVFGILWRHLLPNLAGPIIVYATLTVPQAILQESFLSFLGIGVQAPVPTWGSLAADGVTAINPIVSFWWMVVFPCGLLGLTLLCLNLAGDGLRDALDPQRS